MPATSSGTRRVVESARGPDRPSRHHRGAADVVPVPVRQRRVVPMNSREDGPLRDARPRRRRLEDPEVSLLRLSVRAQDGAASVLARHHGDAEATESRGFDGLALESPYASLRRGKPRGPQVAHATRWVKLTLLWPISSRCLLRIRRFSSRARTGTVRTEVAVGTWRLASMFSTMRNAPPRIGWAMSPGRIVGMAMARETGRLTIGAGVEAATAVNGST